MPSPTSKKLLTYSKREVLKGRRSNGRLRSSQGQKNQVPSPNNQIMAEISITKFQKREMTAIAFGHLEIGKLDIILGFGMVFENFIIE